MLAAFVAFTLATMAQYMCPACGNTSQTQTAANRHLSRCDLRGLPRTFGCPRQDCGECFASASILDDHAALRHADDDESSRADTASSSSGDDDECRDCGAGASDEDTLRSGSASEDSGSDSPSLPDLYETGGGLEVAQTERAFDNEADELLLA
ncbi:hypothetical protein M885DRAFT_578477, partial [Pelagophyceae sp. CCMP2097]